jgi:hypothetical protein
MMLVPSFVRRRWRWGVLGACLLAAVALAVLRARTGRAGPPRGDAPPETYSLSYSQISAGASSGGSGPYSIEHTVRFASGGAPTKKAGVYTVLNPISEANNGIAIDIGTTMRLSWPSSGAPEAALGFDIHRSASGPFGPYTGINPSPIVGNQYDDLRLPDGIYFYIVYLVSSEEGATQWTAPFHGEISVPNSKRAKIWLPF